MRLTKPSFGQVHFQNWFKTNNDAACSDFVLSESLLLPQSIE